MASHKNIRDEVLRLRAENKSTSEIAQILRCSRASVNYHIRGDDISQRRLEKQKELKTCEKCGLFLSRTSKKTICHSCEKVENREKFTECKTCKVRKSSYNFPEYKNYKLMPDGTKMPYLYKKRDCYECLNKANKRRQLLVAGNEENRISNRRKISERHKLKKYGMTKEQFDCMLLKQNSQCKICRIHITPDYGVHRNNKVCIDHCHTTGNVRGLLCHRCNVAIGLLKERCELLDAIKDYLK